MIKKFMLPLVILGIGMIMIILLPVSPALESINATSSNGTTKSTELNNTILSSTMKNSSIMYTSHISNNTGMRYVINDTGNARYSFKLGSLESQAGHKPVRNLEKVVFICNIV